MRRAIGLVGIVVLAGMILTGGALPAATAAPTPGPAVFGPRSSPFGLSYRQWTVRWSRWAFATPTPQNPTADPANCDIGQDGPALLLPPANGTNLEASCTAAEGQGLVAVVGGVIYTADEGDNARQTLDKARAIADDLIRSKITIDGQPGPDVTRFRRAAAFTLDLPADNILGVPAGPTLSAFDGHLLVLQPLAAGVHHVIVKNRFVGDPILYRLDLTVTVE